MAEKEYLKLANKLRRKIQNGEYSLYEQISDERALSKEYDVSRITVRKALDVLSDEGLITREHGRGTFVNGKKVINNLNNFISLTNDLKKHNNSVSTKLIHYSIEKHIKKNEQLNFPLDEELIKIKRLKIEDNDPLVLIVSYIPTSVIPEFELSDFKGSIYDYFKKKYNIKPSYTEQTLQVTLANDALSETLEIPINDPIINITGVTCDDKNREIEFFEGYYRYDKVKFKIKVQNSN